jgi:hypothetical protein
MYWEKISSHEDRAAVYGGWFVRFWDVYVETYTITFLTDPSHSWKLQPKEGG